jgi:hypothetical protein
MAEGVVAHAATICAKPLGSVYEWLHFRSTCIIHPFAVSCCQGEEFDWMVSHMRTRHRRGKRLLVV